MPYYKKETVSDEFLQDMVKAYRDAVEAGGGKPDSSDDNVIKHLETNSAEILGARTLGEQDVTKS